MSARLILSCGEPSGDLYAGALTRELRSLDSGVDVAGMGGPEFSAAGGRLIIDYRGLAVTGIIEPLATVPRYLATISKLTSLARRERPDAAVLIDFPDFNFRLARALKGLGIPVVYYISPQMWAWRPWRLKTMCRVADRVLVIFPFEDAFYRAGGAPAGLVEFVGHPLVDLINTDVSRTTFLAAQGLTPSAPTVAILPGSRPNEVARILPDLVAAAAEMQASVPSVQFVIARAPHLDDHLFDVVRERRLAPVAIAEGDSDGVLGSADVALLASGTATVQAALHDVPMVIVYRLSALTWWLGRRFVTIDTFGMVNLIAGERLCPELIQDDFTPGAAAREAVSMLTDPDRRARIRAGLAVVREKLGSPGASRRAAEAILRVVHAGH